MTTHQTSVTSTHPPLSPAAQAVRSDLAQIMRELHQRCRISISATDALPITLETNCSSLQAGIDILIAAALRAAADQVVPPCSTRSDRGTQRMMIRHELLAIAAEMEGQP